ncbi:hypothetical protein D5F01_LYC25086 [Larimichthys crocea]|uniref:Uncharacterized protein n=1 Tax=Larimichthys crocea TaxID=215358 RepID=A0A6G0HD54_LARCR|nr:hypothetical protein D5F01_LYC25086 [Larimichthys crocea]
MPTLARSIAEAIPSQRPGVSFKGFLPTSCHLVFYFGQWVHFLSVPSTLVPFYEQVKDMEPVQLLPVISSPLTNTGRKDIELLAVLPTWQGSVSSPLSSRCSCHPQDGKVAGSMAPWRGFWQYSSLPGLVKGQGWGAQSLSALIEGQPSITHRQS